MKKKNVNKLKLTAGTHWIAKDQKIIKYTNGATRSWRQGADGKWRSLKANGEISIYGRK